MNEYLTNRQIAFFIFGAIVGYGILSLPKTAAENAGTGAWIAILIATLLSAVFTLMITKLVSKHEGKTIIDYSKKLMGKFVGTIITLIYIVYFFMLPPLIVRNTCEAIKVYLLIKTPVWAMIFLFLIVAYYAVIKKLRAIGMLCEFYGLLIIIAMFVLSFIVSTQGDILLLRPFFGDKSPLNYIKAASLMALPFIGMETLLIIPISKKNKNKISFYTTAIIGIIGLMYIFLVESCFSVRSVDQIIYYKDALIEVVRSVDVPVLEFFSRLDGLFIVTWIMSVFTTITVFSFGASFLLSQWFKKIDFKLVALFVILLSFFISLIPNSVDQVDTLLIYAGYFGVLTVVIIPLILLIVTEVKKNDKQI